MPPVTQLPGLNRDGAEALGEPQGSLLDLVTYWGDLGVIDHAIYLTL